jgi:ribosomal protein S18 acetylase RimI-like enzyme
VGEDKVILKAEIRRFQIKDLDQVLEIERNTFPEPWPKKNFLIPIFHGS